MQQANAVTTTTAPRWPAIRAEADRIYSAALAAFYRPELERALIGAVLAAPEIYVACNAAGSEGFCDPTLARLWDRIGDVRCSGEPLDLDCLRERLAADLRLPGERPRAAAALRAADAILADCRAAAAPAERATELAAEMAALARCRTGARGSWVAASNATAA